MEKGCGWILGIIIISALIMLAIEYWKWILIGIGTFIAICIIISLLFGDTDKGEPSNNDTTQTIDEDDYKVSLDTIEDASRDVSDNTSEQYNDMIKTLSKIYSKYRTYSLECYIEDSPVRVFQKLYPNNHYSQDIELFLAQHNYSATKRGADLPWWGSKYFSGKNGFRIMLVSQDSLASDGGSVVLFSHLLPEVSNREQYERYNLLLNNRQTYAYSSWARIKRQLEEWNINYDFMYITDAAKVYEEGSYNKFDMKLSRDLLEEEIKFVSPNLLVLLGGSPLRLINKSIRYNVAVEAKEYLFIHGIKTVVSPFPSGNGLTQRNFKERITNATDLINRAIYEG